MKTQNPLSENTKPSIRHAAPNLLRELKALRNAAMNTPALDSSEDWTELIKSADAVIAKAEGRA